MCRTHCHVQMYNCCYCNLCGNSLHRPRGYCVIWAAYEQAKVWTRQIDTHTKLFFSNSWIPFVYNFDLVWRMIGDLQRSSNIFGLILRRAGKVWASGVILAALTSALQKTDACCLDGTYHTKHHGGFSTCFRRRLWAVNIVHSRISLWQQQSSLQLSSDLHNTFLSSGFLPFSWSSWFVSYLFLTSVNAIAANPNSVFHLRNKMW